MPTFTSACSQPFCETSCSDFGAFDTSQIIQIMCCSRVKMIHRWLRNFNFRFDISGKIEAYT